MTKEQTKTKVNDAARYLLTYLDPDIDKFTILVVHHGVPNYLGTLTPTEMNEATTDILKRHPNDE